jgi:tRNA(fMet)-specific endonuclease VapC
MEKLRTIPDRQLFTSVVSIWELRHGAARHPQGEQLWARLDREVLQHVTALPVTYEDAYLAGDLLAHLQTSGVVIGIEDILIGATALTRDLVVVTRNLKHLSRVPGACIECWWP